MRRSALLLGLALLAGCGAPASKDGALLPTPAAEMKGDAAVSPKPSPFTLQREADKVAITGFEEAVIGLPPRNNSVCATLSDVLRAAGEEYSYEYVMGVSAAAFRVQVMTPGWCPSAPHSCCGFNCCDFGKPALPFAITDVSAKESAPEKMAAARKAVVESIERGIPAICSSEENGLVVGYQDGGKVLLVRAYAARKPGYAVMKKWPWGFWLLDKKQQPLGRRDAALRAMKQAVELSQTKVYGDQGKYLSGFAAYEDWIAGLEDGKRYEGKTTKDLFGAMLANAHGYYCLIDARASAGIYLKSVAGEFPENVRAPMLRAAEIYGRLADALSPPNRCPTVFAPAPWFLKEGQSWTQELRREEAGYLRQAMALEREALAEIEKALAAAGG